MLLSKLIVRHYGKASGKAIRRHGHPPPPFRKKPSTTYTIINNVITDSNSKKGTGDDTPEFLKSKGQHILTNEKMLKAIVAKAGIRETDTVLEIGPGTGNLTMELLQCAHKVVAVEVDDRMVSYLQKRVSDSPFSDKLEVIHGDILKTGYLKFDICVANIPYQISSPLIFKLLTGFPTFRSATVMFQKEFAQRLVAKPGDSNYNRLAVNVSLLANAKILMHVSKRHFVPCPKVDSSVLCIEPKASTPPIGLDEWSAFTHLCFVRKNKTLGSILKQKGTLLRLLKNTKACELQKSVEDKADNSGGFWSTMYSFFVESNSKEEASDEEECSDEDEYKIVKLKEKLMDILQSAGYENKRPSKLSNQEFLEIISLFNSKGIHFS